MKTCATCAYWLRDGLAPDNNLCLLFSDWAEYGPEPADWPKTEVAWFAPFAGADGGSFVTTASFGCSEWKEQPRTS